jgi:hypothetical protein
MASIFDVLAATLVNQQGLMAPTAQLTVSQAQAELLVRVRCSLMNRTPRMRCLRENQTWQHNHHARVIAAYMQVNMRAPGKSPPSLFKADAWYDQPNFRSQVHIGGNIVGVCRLDRLDGRKLVVKMELRDMDDQVGTCLF